MQKKLATGKKIQCRASALSKSSSELHNGGSNSKISIVMKSKEEVLVTSDKLKSIVLELIIKHVKMCFHTDSSFALVPLLLDAAFL